MISVDFMENFRKIPLSGPEPGGGLPLRNGSGETLCDLTANSGFLQASGPRILGPRRIPAQTAFFPVAGPSPWWFPE